VSLQELGRERLEDSAIDPERAPELYDGILTKRVIAFVVDAVVIGIIMLAIMAAIFLLGIVTLGLGWLLYALVFGPFFALVVLVYVATTLGGPASATPGMQVTGIELRTLDGRRMFPVLAILHAIGFWLSVSFLTPLSLLVGLFTRRRQLLHDLVLGTVALNAESLVRMGR
jgi:uncharacterized RDD family membrane protein YckC